MTQSINLNWLDTNAERTAMTDLVEICGAINPHFVKPKCRVHIWDQKVVFNLDIFDNLAHLPSCQRLEYEQFLGETHENYFERYNKMRKDQSQVKVLLRLLEGSDPLRPIQNPDTDLNVLNSISLCGVDSTLATIDQFDVVLSLISTAGHVLDRQTNFLASRTDLYVLNPKLLKRTIDGKTRTVTSREDISREIGKNMRESEYALACRYGKDSVVIMDGTLFGCDKSLMNSLVAKGIIFVSIVKNPVSRLVVQWYRDVFEQYGYEKVGIDAVAFNDMLPPGTRSPYFFTQMSSKPIAWSSKIFTYLKPAIPGTTVLRVEIPSDYAYLADRLVELVHCACFATGDPLNCTALPIVHAEYAAKAMLPDPYNIADKLKATLTLKAMQTRMQGSYNERRSMPNSMWR